MTTDFNELNLHPQLVQALVELGYQAPMPIQSALIPVMLTGRDVIGQAQTGTGKTAAFALPILQNLVDGLVDVQALVVAPTRELALQVAEAISAYGKHFNVRVLPVYGGAPYGPQIGKLRRGVDVVVGTPGRLIDLIERDVLDLSRVRTVVLDEADEMLSMGFIEDIEKILAETPATRQTALFSATMPAEIRRLADSYLKNPKFIAIESEQITVDTIEQRCYIVHADDKLAALTRLFEVEEVTSALIFVRTRSASGDLANELTLRGFPAEALNGDLSQDARERTLSRFRQNQLTVLVATDVAARGLDIDGISHVFNFDLPEDPEIYVHRIGRTGRAGKAGIAISLVTPSERRRLAQIEAFTRRKVSRGTLPTEEEIRIYREKQVVNQVSVWLQRGRCRRERELVAELQAAGYDVLDIAAAALKVARAEEKQRPIAPISAVPEPLPARTARPDQRPAFNPERSGTRRERLYSERSRNERSQGERSQSERSQGERSHEAGMVRLSLDLGRQHGIRPNDIVGAIAFHADIPGNVIGKISIYDRTSLVDVPEMFAAQVLAKAGMVRIRRQPLNLQRA
ncbi:MAG TPA: DEAD/DEAH box helicase [Anaerolineaceae bacterium]